MVFLYFLLSNNTEKDKRVFIMKKNIDKATEILMKKLDLSKKEALEKINDFSSERNLDTDKTCEVLIKLEKIISPNWFNSSAA